MSDKGKIKLLQLAALSGKRSAVDVVWKACREQGLTIKEVNGALYSRGTSSCTHDKIVLLVYWCLNFFLTVKKILRCY